MSATARLLDGGPRPGRPLRALAASGQLGYGIPERAFREGMSRQPHFIGCDMGSVDVGPYCLGAGKMATTAAVTRRDLRLVLHAALQAGVPLLIGSAGTAGAAPHLELTRGIIRAIAREDGLAFRMAVIHADMPRQLLRAMAAAGRTRPLGGIAPLDAPTIDRAANIVGQMGTGAFVRALHLGVDVILAGRACDTAVFAAVPVAAGYPAGLAMHMAKIIECASICCTPGGRDAMLGTLEDESFTLESMNPARAATPLSVAAHSLYEQADPLLVHEPEGILHVGSARFEPLDARRTRVSGAVWEPTRRTTVKVEGAEWCGERAVLLASSCDPGVIESRDEIIESVRHTVAEIIPPNEDTQYDLRIRTYGAGATSLFRSAPASAPSEIFFLGEAIARDAELARSVMTVTKQYLLHQGFAGRLSTGGNVAFPFTPPEVSVGTAYRFSVYHVTDCEDLQAVFPAEVETVNGRNA